MALSYGSLVKEAIVLLDKFNSGRQCLDDFIEDASNDLQSVSGLQQKFILDVVSGCIEHKKLLDIVVSVFYEQSEMCLSRHDRSRFVVICYLTTFTLDDLGIQHFRNIVKSLDIRKMQTFLTFFFQNLTTWIQKEWSNIYDAAYVETHWIGPLLRWRPEIKILLETISVKSLDGSLVKKSPIKITEPKEFSLTKPKPPSLPMPEIIPQQERNKPVPQSTYRVPEGIQKIEEIKRQNRQKTQELLYEANVRQFRCANPQKSEHTKKVMSQIMEDFNSKLQFDSFQSNVPPSINKTNNAPMKLNRAAMLREEAQYERQKEAEMQKVQHLAEGTRDPSAFRQWQEETRAKELQEELDKIERRYLERCTNYNEGAMARMRLKEQNQRAAQLKKEETADLMRRYAEKRLQEEKKVSVLVQQVTEGHKNSKTAKEKLQRLKRHIVREVSAQSRELLHQALEEAQAELIGKFEMIREIHALESVPHVRFRKFDDTETAGCELLEEMSFAELKERLVLLKEEKQTGQEERRNRIQEQKQKERQQMERVAENLDMFNRDKRATAQAAAVRKQEVRNARLDLEQAVKQSEPILALQKMLEEKKQEYQRMRDEERQRWRDLTRGKTSKTSTQTDSKTLKMKTWEELEDNLEQMCQTLAHDS
ncbi:cilia- and flagella-associated protein 99 [Brachionichthys hirsutus]|uniref:cilia- and flagella-associated protein 99 n=1 Tax=Brachionichthys hirsutus TaxID=412623 RepID=UPI0036049506